MPLSLLVIDCDDFKEINDRAGHEFGDTLLREVADVLSRSIPDGAEAARLGGDEFVVMFPGAGSDSAEALGAQIRTLLAEGLTDAGFPLRISAGVSTYPFDGATPTALLRAGDQALYAAKATGKDRVASFRELTVAAPVVASESERGARRRAAADGATARERCSPTRWPRPRRSTPRRPSTRSARGCARPWSSSSARPRARPHASSVTTSSTRPSTRSARSRSGTRPRTASPTSRSRPRCCASGEPRAVSFADGDVDPAEAFILRDLGMNALLMLPMRVRGNAWGLVELYEMRHRRFSGGGRRGRAVPRRAGRASTRGGRRLGRRDAAGRRSTSCPSDGVVAPAWAAREVGAPPGVAGKRRAPDPRDDEDVVPDLELEPGRQRTSRRAPRARSAAPGTNASSTSSLSGRSRAAAASRSASSASRASSARSRRSTAARLSSTAPSSWRRCPSSSSAWASSFSRRSARADTRRAPPREPRGRTYRGAASARPMRASRAGAPRDARARRSTRGAAPRGRRALGGAERGAPRAAPRDSAPRRARAERALRGARPRGWSQGWSCV